MINNLDSNTNHLPHDAKREFRNDAASWLERLVREHEFVTEILAKQQGQLGNFPPVLADDLELRSDFARKLSYYQQHTIGLTQMLNETLDILRNSTWNTAKPFHDTDTRIFLLDRLSRHPDLELITWVQDAIIETIRNNPDTENNIAEAGDITPYVFSEKRDYVRWLAVFKQHKEALIEIAKKVGRQFPSEENLKIIALSLRLGLEEKKTTSYTDTSALENKDSENLDFDGPYPVIAICSPDKPMESPRNQESIKFQPSKPGETLRLTGYQQGHVHVPFSANETTVLFPWPRDLEETKPIHFSLQLDPQTHAVTALELQNATLTVHSADGEINVVEPQQSSKGEPCFAIKDSATNESELWYKLGFESGDTIIIQFANGSETREVSFTVNFDDNQGVRLDLSQKIEVRESEDDKRAKSQAWIEVMDADQEVLDRVMEEKGVTPVDYFSLIDYQRLVLPELSGNVSTHTTRALRQELKRLASGDHPLFYDQNGQRQRPDEVVIAARRNDLTKQLEQEIARVQTWRQDQLGRPLNQDLAAAETNRNTEIDQFATIMGNEIEEIRQQLAHLPPKERNIQAILATITELTNLSLSTSATEKIDAEQREAHFRDLADRRADLALIELCQRAKITWADRNPELEAIALTDCYPDLFPSPVEAVRWLDALHRNEAGVQKLAALLGLPNRNLTSLALILRLGINDCSPYIQYITEETADQEKIATIKPPEPSAQQASSEILERALRRSLQSGRLQWQLTSKPTEPKQP